MRLIRFLPLAFGLALCGVALLSGCGDSGAAPGQGGTVQEDQTELQNREKMIEEMYKDKAKKKK